MTGRIPPWPTSALLALVGGLAWAACFTAETRAWLAFVALVPLFFLVDRPRPYLFSWIFGAAAWLPSLHWIAPTLETFGQLHPALAIALWAALGLYLGLEAPALVFVARRLTGPEVDPVHRLWILPSAWVLLEAQRGFFVNGFPWNLASYAWVDVPGALPLSSYIGATGLSFLVVAAHVALWLALARRRRLTASAVWLGIALVLVLAGRFAPEPSDDGKIPRPVRIVQPNTPITFDRDTLLANYEQLVADSHLACDTPSLLVWPESAAWPFGWFDAPRLRRDVEALNRRGCSVILNTPSRHGDEIRNAALLISPASPGRASTEPPHEYAKRRLVPWGEYVPFARVFPFIGRLARHAGSFSPGTEVALLPWRDEQLGMAICYEVIFPGSVAEQVRAGASVLLTVTNDAWYGDTAAPWQHYRAARFRAAENRRPLLRAALTGVSAILDARGREVARLGVDEKGILEARIAGGEGLSPFSRVPFLPLLASGLLLAFAMMRSIRRARGPGKHHGVPPAGSPHKTTEEPDRAGHP